MKKCVNCGAENSDGSLYCESCGAILDEPAETTCAVCGAELNGEAKFCGKCGARVIKSRPRMPERCESCGAVISDGAAFCRHCGKAVGGETVAENNGANNSGVRTAPTVDRGGKFGAAVKSVFAFDAKHCLITNVVIAVLAIVFICVSLVCPVKIGGTSMTMFVTGGTTADTDDAAEITMTIDQSIYKVLGSLSYLDLDMDDAEDADKIEKICDEIEDVGKKMQTEYQRWLSRNDDASEEERQAKQIELIEKHFKDVNFSAYIFAITTVGAYDAVSGTENEGKIADMLDTLRAEAVVAVVLATIVSIAQILVAAVSAVYLVLALIGLVCKRKNKIMPFFVGTLVASGLSLVLLAVAPMFAVGGAMLAIALTSALSWLVYSTVRAIAVGTKPKAVIKNAVCAALSIVTFFLLCSPFIGAKQYTAVGSNEAIQSYSAYLGTTLDTMIASVMMEYASGVTYMYSDTSVACAIITLIVGVTVYVVLLAATVTALVRLAAKPEKAQKFNILACVAAVLLVALAIVTAAVGAADEYPNVSAATGSNTVATVKVLISMCAYVYVAIGFAVANSVFSAVFRADADKTATPVNPEPEPESKVNA